MSQWTPQQVQEWQWKQRQGYQGYQQGHQGYQQGYSHRPQLAVASQGGAPVANALGFYVSPQATNSAADGTKQIQCTVRMPAARLDLTIGPNRSYAMQIEACSRCTLAIIPVETPEGQPYRDVIVSGRSVAEVDHAVQIMTDLVTKGATIQDAIAAAGPSADKQTTAKSNPIAQGGVGHAAPPQPPPPRRSMDEGDGRPQPAKRVREPSPLGDRDLRRRSTDDDRRRLGRQRDDGRFSTDRDRRETRERRNDRDGDDRERGRQGSWSERDPPKPVFDDHSNSLDKKPIEPDKQSGAASAPAQPVAVAGGQRTRKQIQNEALLYIPSKDGQLEELRLRSLDELDEVAKELEIRCKREMDILTAASRILAGSNVSLQEELKTPLNECLVKLKAAYSERKNVARNKITEAYAKQKI